MGDPLLYLDATEARLALLALDLARRTARPLLDRWGVTGDVAVVAAKIRGSFDGTAPGVSPTASPVHAADLCTVPVAAALWQCSPRAVVKAIHAGRVRAWRPGREWLLDVREVRQQAGRRRSHGNAEPSADNAHDPGGGQDGPSRRRKRPQVGAAGRSR